MAEPAPSRPSNRVRSLKDIVAKTLTLLLPQRRSSELGGTLRLDQPPQARPKARPVTIEIFHPPDPPRRYPLAGGDTYLGRSDRVCAIVIPTSSISHVHARIRERAPLSHALPPLLHWLPLEGLLWGLGWYRSRYIIQDQDSTNGLYRQGRRIQQTPLAHRALISLGPPRDLETVKLVVSDPPPLLVYVARGVMVLLGGLTTAAVVWAVQEWPKIRVDPLPALARGPVTVIAGDGQTQLRRTWSDTHQDLPNLSAFGPNLPRVLVAAEDHRFYFHWGVDVIGILRAFFVNFRAGEVQQGGSSITQQLARNILRDYTGGGNTLGRKLRESLAALKLEWYYSKEQLLTLYLNNVYLGNGLYGFEAASRFYFGVPAAQLDLAQAAMLVSVLPAPNATNPLDNFQAAMRGRERVLDRISELRALPEEEIRRARRSRVKLNPNLQSLSPTVAPYFYNTVIKELTALLGSDLASEGNFIVETSLQLPLQAAAERAVAAAVRTQGAQYGFSQGALVTLDSRTGEVLALVGGTNYQETQFNRAVQARRQPGSTFKIFVYIAALWQGISPQDVYSCAPLDWGGQVFNGCRSGSGSLDVLRAVIHSENPIVLRAAQQVGLNRVIQVAQLMGIRSPLQPYPALVLGTIEVTLLELTSAFGVLANQGTATRPHTIRRILDSTDCTDRRDWRTCRVIYPDDREDPIAPRPVIPVTVATTMTEMLAAAVTHGTGRRAYLGRGEAGKTGTTTGNKDLVFVGYLPNPALVTGVWLGNDDSTPTRGSSAQAAQLWSAYMRQVLR